MSSRPLSVSIIGWLLVVTAAFSVFGLMTMTSNPVTMQVMAQSGMPIAFHMTIGLIGTIVSLACGYAILKGMDWGRVVYVAWGLVAAAISFFTSPFPSAIILGLALLAIAAFFLFRPAANAWFGKTYLGPGGDGAPRP